MAQLIKTDGTTIEVQPKGKYFTFEEFKTLMGIDEDSLIQLVSLGDKYIACDEEGKLKGYELNGTATAMAHEKRAIFPFDNIVGNVVVCGVDLYKLK